MLNKDLKEQIKKLPGKPGIYLFKNSKNKPLYIGKALNIKNRVSQYLRAEDQRLTSMISESRKVDFIEANSDIEALIMESQFIKNHRPYFNIVLRDDKQYFYVGITKESFPMIYLTHQPAMKQLKRNTSSEFTGPFTDGSAIKSTLRYLRRIFPYCTCKQKHNNYCLNYHIGKCAGFCCLKQQNPSENLKAQSAKYRKDIRAIKDILGGKKESLIKQFEKEMRNLAQEHDFEKAIELQRKIESIKRVFQNAQIIRKSNDNGQILENIKRLLDLPVFPERIEAFDIANIQGDYAVGAMVVFINGKPDKNEYRKFKIYSRSTADLPGRQAGDTGMLKEVISRRFKHPEWRFPDLIVIDGGKGQLNAATSVISSFYPPAGGPISKQTQSASWRTKNQNRIPIIALTKDEKHIGVKIFIQNRKEAIPLSSLPIQVKNMLLSIDAEAHRFAINYYRLLHKKSVKQ